MPTGYTAAVQSGEITDFNTFAMACARAFGALVTMRDDPAGAAIPEEFKPSTDYHDKAIERARVELLRLYAMSDAEKDAEAGRAQVEALRSWAKSEADTEDHRARYLAMLEKVEAWTPPTDEHAPLKTFMADQLRSSIEFDCSPNKAYYKVERATGAAWFVAALRAALRDLEYHEKARAEEIKRTTERNAWIKALRAALA